MTARRVIITGANSGIGLATAIELARRGFDSVGTVRSSAKARAVEEAARAAGVAVRTVRLELTDAGACARVIARLRPWGLVNNAGYSGVGAIEDVSDEEARLQLETMVLAPMRLARLALPHMRRAGGGRIVNVSSVYGRATTPLTGWYQAAKHALEAASDALRVEVASAGIRVVLIEPGGFDTAIWDEAAGLEALYPDRRYTTAYRRAAAAAGAVRPHFGRPEAVARVIAGALASPRPRPRYLVGRDARPVTLYASLVPTEVRDRLARIALSL